MTKRDDCIFCKVVAGEIPCTKVLDDETLLAFMDISPLNNGHLLIVPKEHFENIFEIDPQTYGHLAATACRLSKAIGASLSPDGVTVMQLNGKAANQAVPHLHIHVVPRWKGDGLTISAWEPATGDKEEISRNAESIKSKL
jgi:histidine triad (HIT) family protein